MDRPSRMAAGHGEIHDSASQALILDGWHLVTGDLKANDKIWAPERLAWIIVTVNSGLRAEQFPAAIRKDEPCPSL